MRNMFSMGELVSYRAKKLMEIACSNCGERFTYEAKSGSGKRKYCGQLSCDNDREKKKKLERDRKYKESRKK